MLTLSFPHSFVVGFSLSNKVPMYLTPRRVCKIRTVHSVQPRVYGHPVPPQWVYYQSIPGMDVNEIAKQLQPFIYLLLKLLKQSLVKKRTAG
jgi:hypothetical protein